MHRWMDPNTKADYWYWLLLFSKDMANRGKRIGYWADCWSFVFCVDSLSWSDSALKMLGCPYDMQEFQCILRKYWVWHRPCIKSGESLSQDFSGQFWIVMVGYEYKTLVWADNWTKRRRNEKKFCYSSEQELWIERFYSFWERGESFRQLHRQ